MATKTDTDTDTNSANCPICGGPNQCGEINPEHRIDGRCWCAFETFPKAIFDLVPADKLNKACICRTCLGRFKNGELSKT